MPRARRQWSALRAEIYTLLRETEGASFWTPAQLLVLFNSALDHRVMQLATLDEGWVTDEYETDLVEDQREYPLPEGAGRVKRVVIQHTTGGVKHERECHRDEQWGKNVYHGIGATSIESYHPTFRLQGNLIVLEPKPEFGATDGLRIDLELAPDRLSQDSSKIDLRFPDVMETLLVYDTVILALKMEHSLGRLPEDYLNHLMSFQKEYEAAFIDYCTDRTEGRFFGQPYRLGA
jgi:hypothetical protein